MREMWSICKLKPQQQYYVKNIIAGSYSTVPYTLIGDNLGEDEIYKVVGFVLAKEYETNIFVVLYNCCTYQLP
jgi:hypothetical protein